MELDIHLLDLKYEPLRARNVKEEKRLLSSIAGYGQLSPVIVLSCKDEESRYVVVDGFKRIRVMQRLGHDTVKAAVWEEDEVSGLVAAHHLQKLRNPSALDDAYLLVALQDIHGLSQWEIGSRLGRSQSWVSRRLGLLKDLPKWMQEMVHEGMLQCHAALKYLLPMARANRDDAESLARKIQGMDLSTRDIGRLYAAWCRGDMKGRELVVNHPQIVLRAIRKEEIIQIGLDHLICDLQGIESCLDRIRELAERIRKEGMEAAMRDQANPVWQRLRLSFQDMDKRIGEEVVEYER
jgi:ParB/RepB/Spo0J family partition protein